MHLFYRKYKLTVFENRTKSREASYVYILNGQKLMENAKNGTFWQIFGNLKLAVKQCYQPLLIVQKSVENPKIIRIAYHQYCQKAKS